MTARANHRTKRRSTKKRNTRTGAIVEKDTNAAIYTIVIGVVAETEETSRERKENGEQRNNKGKTTCRGPHHRHQGHSDWHHRHCNRHQCCHHCSWSGRSVRWEKEKERSSKQTGDKTSQQKSENRKAKRRFASTHCWPTPTSDKTPQASRESPSSLTIFSTFLQSLPILSRLSVCWSLTSKKGLQVRSYLPNNSSLGSRLVSRIALFCNCPVETLPSLLDQFSCGLLCPILSVVWDTSTYRSDSPRYRQSLPLLVREALSGRQDLDSRVNGSQSRTTS